MAAVIVVELPALAAADALASPTEPDALLIVAIVVSADDQVTASVTFRTELSV